MAWRNKMAGAERISSLVYPGAKIVVFDTETTGLSSKKARIIQFSGILYEVQKDLGFVEKNRMDCYINPECPIPPNITDITGITDEMVRLAQPMSIRFPEIAQFLRSCDLWAGQNIHFDIRMVMAEAQRTGMYLQEKNSVDLLSMSRDWLRKGEDVEDYKLGTVFGMIFPDSHITFHDSMEDVKATGMLIQYFTRKYFHLLENRDEVEAKEEKESVTVNRASVFVNQHNPRQQRIILTLSQGERGDIYYDVIDKQWSCKTSTSAKKLFAKVDMEDIERQVLSKYYQYQTMDDLAKSWMAFWRQNHKKASGK